MGAMRRFCGARRAAGATVLVLLGLAAAALQADGQAPAPPPPAAADVNLNAPDQSSAPEVLTRGPIHEAYAAPVTTGGLKPLTVPKAPPPPVEEVPPDVKPEDPNAVWIPGYWAWDDDRKDFIWVSGVWRVPPAGSTWVAGYWTEVEGGWRWVPGFWTSAQSQEATYYPEPPETLEQGPTSEPASPDYFWVPGCWEWRAGRYVWRPGYWAVVQPDWVWIPASYCWTPRGWVYVAGYWDYPLWRRGVLFAPVCFYRPVWRVGFVYRPAVVVDIGAMTLHLFARPICYHYYFGDYYAPVYETWGFYPWFAVYRYRYYHYDPLFVYCRWYYHHHDPRWESHLRGWHRYFREHEDLRPPRTLAQQQMLNERLKARRDLDPHVVRTVTSTVTLAAPVSEFRKRPDAPVRLTELSSVTRLSAQQQARELRNVAIQRRKIEVESAPRAPAPKLPAKKPAGPLAGEPTSPAKSPKPGVQTKPAGAAPALEEKLKPGSTRGPMGPQRLALPPLPKLSSTPATEAAGPSAAPGSGAGVSAGGASLTGGVRPAPGAMLPSAPKSAGVPGGPPAPRVPLVSPKPADTPGGPALAPRVPPGRPKSSGDMPKMTLPPGAPSVPAPPDARPPSPQFRKAAAPPAIPPSFRRPAPPSPSDKSDASPASRGGEAAGSSGSGRGKR